MNFKALSARGVYAYACFCEHVSDHMSLITLGNKTNFF